MGFRRALFGVILICLFAGAVSAMTNVTSLTQVNQARWAGSGAGASVITQGGNITNANITSVVQLTNKWADIYGNISGTSLQLRDASNNIVYTWAYSAASGRGEVCASTGSTFPSGTPITGTTADMNSLWNLGSVDNATNTYNTTFSNLNISGTVLSPIATKIEGSSNFTVGAIVNATGIKSNYAFCTNINNTGTNYLGTNYNYELLVPTTPGGVETYYFYIELDG